MAYCYACISYCVDFTINVAIFRISILNVNDVEVNNK